MTACHLYRMLCCVKVRFGVFEEVRHVCILCVILLADAADKKLNKGRTGVTIYSYGLISIYSR